MAQDINDICGRVLSKIEKVSSNEIMNKTSSKAFQNLTQKVFQNQVKSTLHETTDSILPKPILSKIQKPIIPPKESLGKGWFNLKPIEITDSVKRDLQLIQMRNYIDPKRFYKNPEKNFTSRVLHIGTVIEGSGEYRSSRLTKKERKQTILEEVLGDKTIRDYTKKTTRIIQEKKSNKRKVYKTSKNHKHK